MTNATQDPIETIRMTLTSCGCSKKSAAEALAALNEIEGNVLPPLPPGWGYSWLALSERTWGENKGPVVAVHSDKHGCCFPCGSGHFDTPRNAALAAIAKVKP